MQPWTNWLSHHTFNVEIAGSSPVGCSVKRWYSITVSTLACHAIGRGSIPRITASRNGGKVSHWAHTPELAVRICLPQLIFRRGRAVEGNALLMHRGEIPNVGSSPTVWANALVAQLKERFATNEKVGGLSPSESAKVNRVQLTYLDALYAI